MVPTENTQSYSALPVQIAESPFGVKAEQPKRSVAAHASTTPGDKRCTPAPPESCATCEDSVMRLAAVSATSCSRAVTTTPAAPSRDSVLAASIAKSPVDSIETSSAVTSTEPAGALSVTPLQSAFVSVVQSEVRLTSPVVDRTETPL